ncbi:MAG: hypothetical protein Q4C97_08110 [Bacillota bacterium]|nr:hypothetical protein [Bacillota bacterium]
MEKDMKYIEEQERGMYFSKKKYEEEPLYTYEMVKDKLPVPVVEGRKRWKESYDYSVKILF